MLTYRYRLLLAWLFAAPRDFDGKGSSPSAAPLTRSPPDTPYGSLIEQLFRTYYAPLCRAVRPMVRDRDTAEDIVQDTWAKRCASCASTCTGSSKDTRGWLLDASDQSLAVLVNKVVVKFG